MHDNLPLLGGQMSDMSEMPDLKVPAQTRRAFLERGGALAGLGLLGLWGAPAQAGITAFMQAVAEAAARDKEISAFYRETGYQPIWTGNGGRDRARRAALLKAISEAGIHGLPQEAYDTRLLQTNMRSVKSMRDLGRIEVALSQLFLDYARDIQTGVLIPSRVDREIARKVPLRNRLDILRNFAKSSPAAYIRKLPPASAEYRRLLKAKLLLERQLGRGGWGAQVPAGRKLEPGASGAAVVALRNRLIAMGYMRRSNAATYDAALQQAVQKFQLASGLNPDGIAGKGTLRAINVPLEKRLASVVVALERERWINMPLGKRHIWVNLADFSAAIVDNGKVTFRTRAVVGANKKDRRSPEFSDEMEYMVLNPTWNVPRSIAVKEYLPLMQQDPTAAAHLRILDEHGQDVSREGIDFTQFDETNFPFDLKQPPSRRNALGLVKFMFPNKFNIYLHDTPAKRLFSRETRAYSHGCIRLNKPFEFAYRLLAPQVSDPKAYFQAKLATGQETIIDLKQHVPVHLVYRTAFTDARGGLHFRRDIYGRDARIFAALQKAGVRLRKLA